MKLSIVTKMFNSSATITQFAFNVCFSGQLRTTRPMPIAVVTSPSILTQFKSSPSHSPPPTAVMTKAIEAIGKANDSSRRVKASSQRKNKKAARIITQKPRKLNDAFTRVPAMTPQLGFCPTEEPRVEANSFI